MQGKSVRLFLVEGSATGIVTAEIMNWIGHVLVTPRSRLKEALDRDEAKRTGVYILLGDDPDNPNQQKIYIGEGDTVKDRVNAHARDETKEFWERAFLITSKDKNLTKAHVRYLEGRLIQVAEHAGRVNLANEKASNLDGFLPESDTSDMEFFLSQMRVVLPVVGLDALRDKPSKVIEIDPAIDGVEKSPATFLQLSLINKKHGYSAKAIEQDGELVVLKDSQALANPPHTFNSYKNLRDQLLQQGDLQVDPTDTQFLKFSRDISFNSPSAAAAVINGRSSNGRTEWIVESTGKTLKEHQEAELSENSE